MSTVQYRADIAKWVDGAKISGRQVAVLALAGMIQATYERTPVDTGLLRGSWFAGLDSVPSGRGAAEREMISEAMTILRGLVPGQTFYFVNTAPYASRLEYGFVGSDSLGRGYNQSGRYYVRSVVLDAPRIAEQAAGMVSGLGGAA